MVHRDRDVRFVPKADIMQRSKVWALVALEVHFGFRFKLRLVFAYIGQLFPNLRQSL
jgi:hypothetical protein